MNPDDLLRQIRGLLDQYLSMGGQTPVAPEAQALADAIDSKATGTSAAPAAAAAGGSGLPDASAAGGGGPSPADVLGALQAGGYSGSSPRGARGAAKGAMMKAKKKAKA